MIITLRLLLSGNHRVFELIFIVTIRKMSAPRLVYLLRGFLLKKFPACTLIEILLTCFNLSYSRLFVRFHLFYFISNLSVCSGILKWENWTELNWTELNWTELNWTELNWTELNWTELNWTERCRTPEERYRNNELHAVVISGMNESSVVLATMVSTGLGLPKKPLNIVWPNST